MKKIFLKFGVGNGLLLLAILFSIISASSLLASAHNAHNTTSTTSATSTPTSAACQQYLQGLSQRLSIPVATLEKDSQLAKEDTLVHSPCD